MAGPEDSVHVFCCRPRRVQGQHANRGLAHCQCPAFAAAGPVMMSGAAASVLRRRLASRFGYTRNVSWSHRLTGLALAFALSGSPAVLAACMALCQDGPVTTAGHAGHGARATEVMLEVAPQTHNHDHGAATAPATAEPASRLPAAPQASDVRLVAMCTDCCPDGEFGSVAGLSAERRDVDAASVAATERATSFDFSRAVQASSPSSPPSPPTSPARSPLALRI